jgi:hypothetical protein
MTVYEEKQSSAYIERKRRAGGGMEAYGDIGPLADRASQAIALIPDSSIHASDRLMLVNWSRTCHSI